MHRRKKVDEKSCVTPAGTSIDVQNEWEENTHTHIPLILSLRNLVFWYESGGVYLVNFRPDLLSRGNTN